MAMNPSQGAGNREMSEVNTTPLIDVMLVMLVMMIMTLPAQYHGTTMESSLSPSRETLPSIFIDIDPDGTVVWNNEPLSGFEALEARFRQEARKSPQPQIQLRPSALASYDVVAKVMASAQRNKMQRMGFTNVGEFAD